jgi:hypothetical protein
VSSKVVWPSSPVPLGIRVKPLPRASLEQAPRLLSGAWLVAATEESAELCDRDISKHLALAGETKVVVFGVGWKLEPHALRRSRLGNRTFDANRAGTADASAATVHCAGRVIVQRQPSAQKHHSEVGPRQTLDRLASKDHGGQWAAPRFAIHAPDVESGTLGKLKDDALWIESVAERQRAGVVCSSLACSGVDPKVANPTDAGVGATSLWLRRRGPVDELQAIPARLTDHHVLRRPAIGQLWGELDANARNHLYPLVHRI